MRNDYSFKDYAADKRLVGLIETNYKTDMSTEWKLKFLRDSVGYKSLRGGIPGVSRASTTSIDDLIKALPKNELAIGSKALKVLNSVYLCALKRIDGFEIRLLEEFESDDDAVNPVFETTHAAETHPED